jgi:hypothetical protein
MTRKHSRTTAALAAAVLLAPALLAQAPKPGDWYEDKVDLGFKLRAPDWELVPAQPNEPNLIVKYAPRNGRVNLGSGELVFLNCWLVKFDKRAKPDDGSDEKRIGDRTVRISNDGARDIDAWIKEELREVAYTQSPWGPVGVNWMYDKKSYPKELKGVDVPAVYYVYEAQTPGGKEELGAYVALFTLSDELQVALVGNGPGDSRKWRDYERTYERLAKTFERVQVEAVAGIGEGKGLRDRKRATLMQEAARSGDWKLYETPNYFVVSNNDDKAFLEELLERLEAIRKVYEEDYPPAQARLIRQEAEDEDEDTEKSDEEEKEDENRSVSAIDPMELSRTSVVRVCKDQNLYHEYGGPTGSAGYWSWPQEELVIYDDKAGGGRNDTWIVLNHEAFHQYIFYFYGNISPHSWYNEGTGDFYSGYEYKYRRFKLKENPWRVRRIQEMIREENYAPLKDFVRWTQKEYYGKNSRGLEGGECYAQGWSLIYFLRTGKENKARGWKREWDEILDTYLAELVESGDLDKAVDKAFEGVDWEEFETAWKDYIG